MNHNGGPYIPTPNGRKYHVSRLPFSRPDPRAGPSRPKRLEEQRLLPQRQESKGRRFLVLKGHDKGRLRMGWWPKKTPKGKPSGRIQRRSPKIMRMDDIGLRKCYIPPIKQPRGL